MYRWQTSCAFIVAIVVGVLASPGGLTDTASASAPHGVADLRSDLDKILSDPRLAAAKVGVDVRSASDDTSLYSRGVDEAVMPASNAKLFTAATALDVLGPDYQFRTTVHAAGKLTGSTLYGDLTLRGTGDPTVRPDDYDALAQGVAAGGIGRVEGRLLADASYFDDQRWNPNWDPAYEPYGYAAQISALTVATTEVFDTGSVQVDITAGKQGKPLEVSLSPAGDYVKLENTSTTGAPGSASTLVIDRPKGSNTVVVSGSHPSDATPVQKLRSVDDPALYAISIFRAALSKHGVTVTNESLRGSTPSAARVVASKESAPLGDIMTPFLKLSNNGIAEILTKTVGKKAAGEGSWRAGTKVIGERIRSFGVDTKALTLVDGSGLSFNDRVSARTVADVLSKVRGKKWFSIYNNALPVAGQSEKLVGGTLASRMVDTPAAGNVHAKTGTLTGASALSGYLRDSNRRTLVFSIFFNGYPGSAPTDIQDAVAVRLASGGDVVVHRPTPTPLDKAGKREWKLTWERELESSWVRTY
ncbi:MAG: D-alanyl-D-alanine carboxypeptidase/D-alanyl-D-alanine endopeptidase [Mycobacteriales bacterium]